MLRNSASNLNRPFPVVVQSYARKLVTAWSGGGLKLLDPVLEGNPLDDLWQAICPVELSPFYLR